MTIGEDEEPDLACVLAVALASLPVLLDAPSSRTAQSWDQLEELPALAPRIRLAAASGIGVNRRCTPLAASRRAAGYPATRSTPST